MVSSSIGQRVQVRVLSPAINFYSGYDIVVIMNSGLVNLNIFKERKL